MSYLLEQKVQPEDRDNAVVFFLKDDISADNLHQDGTWNDFSDMLTIASSERGFACGIKPSYVDAGPSRYFVSAYHEYDTMKEFSMSSYSRNIKGYAADTVDFRSSYNTLEEWANSMPGMPAPQEIVQVCYGGVFAAAVANIVKQEPALWSSITQSLSRGNNIQEGHFAERSWARLLSTPLLPVQVRAITDTADGVYLNERAMHGPLTRTPKLFVHAGAPVTNVAAVEQALVTDMDRLKLDGYRVAVHGRGHETGIDIDRLAACMWGGFERKAFPTKDISSTFCPPNLLNDFQQFLDDAMEERRDVILSNPWLARDQTADALGHFLDSHWEVHPVVYYRRYYSWISAVYRAWRKDAHWSPKEIPMSSIRLIDFIREYCKRLFYGNMIPDDSPYREFTSTSLSNEKHRQHQHATSFHPDLPIEELTDLNEYSYFIAKQYDEIPRFTDKVHIVNYHDHDLASNLYCDVLTHAPGACSAAKNREHPRGTNSKSIRSVLEENSRSLLDESNSYEEIALGAYMQGLLIIPKGAKTGFHAQVKRWSKLLKERLERSETFSFDDLPVECLEDFELHRLLQVSLAYEKTLLPDYFASPQGEPELRRDFARHSFCAVDVAEVVSSMEWSFLFDDGDDTVSEESSGLLPAFVHIGGPNTDSTAVQQGLIRDKEMLSQDGYYLAIHGAVRPWMNVQDDPAIGNMFYESDHIAACLWDDEERERVAAVNAPAAVCQPELLPRFQTFVDQAAKHGTGVVLSNEWLSRLSTETALASTEGIFDDQWDVNIVLYYRRYYDWLWSMYWQWRENLTFEYVNNAKGKVRFVDFARLVNRRLFAAGGIGEHNDGNVDAFVDLVDVQEYTYQLYRQFSTVDRFQSSIQIVDYHGGDWNTKLYCDVLQGADNACNNAVHHDGKNEANNAGVDVATVDVDEHKNVFLTNFVVGAFYHNLLPEHPDGASHGLSEETIRKWRAIVEQNLQHNGMSIHDLPMECLNSSELDLLQDVSLAYEKMLMPKKFSNGGAASLREDFDHYVALQRFCSLDFDAMFGTSDEFEFLLADTGATVATADETSFSSWWRW
jgi:hypothetical protein